jgi:quinol monooxygenase YgiN
MHARIMHVTMKPERIDEARALWPKTTATFKASGLRAGYMLLIDRDAGKILSITIWDSMESIKANEDNPDLKEAMKPFQEFFAADPWSEYAEVGAFVE